MVANAQPQYPQGGNIRWRNESDFSNVVVGTEYSVPGLAMANLARHPRTPFFVYLLNRLSAKNFLSPPHTISSIQANVPLSDLLNKFNNLY